MTVSRGGSPDKILLAEALATIEGAADMCVAAASPSTSLDEALRLRRIVRVQLDIAARLIFEVRRASGIIREGAAAAGSSDPVIAAPLTLSEEAAMAVNSDQPVTSSGIPGLDAASWYATGAQGSTGSMRPDSSELGQATVAADPFQSGQGPRPMAAQGYGSTSNDSDPMKDVVSGTVTPPAVVAGATVAGPHHPNAGR